MNKLKIIIVDDHKLFRQGIYSLFENDEYIEVAGESDSAEKMFPLLNTVKPNVVLMDISLPGTDGLTAIKEALKKYPEIKFIVLTMHADGQYVIKAIKSGAFGYLLKNTTKEELSEAIFTVCSGNKFFNKKVSLLMVGNISDDGEDIQPLSKREKQIIQMISDGKTNKEIAETLFISIRTVETHRVNMMKKLDVSNAAELIKKAIKLRLVQ